MPAYDALSFGPPAPVAHVAVSSPGTGAIVENVSMLIDTGADVSLLPRAPIAELIDSAEAGSHYELEGFDGTRSLAPAVQLEVRFLGRVFRGQFLIIDQNHGILGRNVLNSISLTLDGPNLTWHANE